MYRIELRPGEETVFRTIEELATGIRNGLVTSRARIFHNASQKWLPIEFHPHYKKALTMPATKSGETPAVAMPPRPSSPPSMHAHSAIHAAAPAPAPRGGLTFIALAPEPARAPTAHSAAMAAAAVVETAATPFAVTSPVVDLPTISYTDSAPEVAALPVAHAPLGRGPLGRPKALHLGVAAAVLIVAAYVALSAARSTPTAAADPAPPPAVPAPGPAIEQPAPVEQAAAQSTSGPTFGGPPAPATVLPKRPITASIGATPAAAKAADSTAIEPPPIDVDLSIPSLPRGESLAPSVANDSNAIRRILKAVGGKAAPAAPAQP